MIKLNKKLRSSLLLLVLTAFPLQGCYTSSPSHSASQTSQASQDLPQNSIELENKDYVPKQEYLRVKQQYQNEKADLLTKIIKLEQDKDKLKEKLDYETKKYYTAASYGSTVEKVSKRTGYNMRLEVTHAQKELQDYKDHNIPVDYYKETNELKNSTEIMKLETENIKLRSENLRLRKLAPNNPTQTQPN